MKEAFTYDGCGQVCVVGQSKKCVIVIVQVRLALQSELVERFEAVEAKC